MYVVAFYSNVGFPETQPIHEGKIMDIEPDRKLRFLSITILASDVGFPEIQPVREGEIMDFEPNRRLHFISIILQILTLIFQRYNLFTRVK